LLIVNQNGNQKEEKRKNKKHNTEKSQNTAHNKAYTLRSEYLAWPSAHLPLSRGKKLLDLYKLIEYKIFSKFGKRRISKALCAMAVSVKLTPSSLKEDRGIFFII